MFVFGIDIPLPEILFVLIVLLVAALVFIIYQMRYINKHVKVLEDTTLEIRKYEEQEMEQVRRFETDMKNFEADEAEMFVAKVIPTVSKLENYVSSELLKRKNPEAIKANLERRGIKPELAAQVINAMTYYLDFFQKLPKTHAKSHFNAVNRMRVQQPAQKK